VRAGSLVSLPVLMNDHDPNEDVLSIDPASVVGLDPDFGTASITDDDQRLTVRVAPGATGTATLSYAVTDGTAEGGLLSESTTVVLTVAPDAVNSAPEWCGVERCLVEWPTPEVSRGWHGHGAGAARMGGPRGRPAAAPRRREPLRQRQRRRDAGWRRGLPAQRQRRRRRAARRAHRDDRRHERAGRFRSRWSCACRRSRCSRCSRSRWSTPWAAGSRWMSRRT
jgi:hypothetical protein